MYWSIITFSTVVSHLLLGPGAAGFERMQQRPVERRQQSCVPDAPVGSLSSRYIWPLGVKNNACAQG